MIGARSDSIAGDPCICSLRVRALAANSSPRPRGQDHQPRADRSGCRSSLDRRALRSPVPGHDRLPGWFAHLPDQSQYNRRLRRLTPYIVMVQLELADELGNRRFRYRGEAAPRDRLSGRSEARPRLALLLSPHGPSPPKPPSGGRWVGCGRSGPGGERRWGAPRGGWVQRPKP